jgi:hypothetical protein
MSSLKTRIMVGAVLAIVAAVGMADAAATYLPAAIPTNAETVNEQAGSGFTPIFFVNMLGPPSTLQQARQSVGVNFSMPTLVPSGVKLVDIRSSNNTAALVYYGKGVPKIPFYDNATMLVLVLRGDGTSFSGVPTSAGQPQVSVTSGNTTTVANVPVYSEGPTLKAVTISGHQGWGTSPIDLKWTGHNSGRLDWWSNGVHYVILGDFPLDTLIATAQSMNT